jgi:hypothetical protein
MKYTLADSLDILLPNLFPVVVSPVEVPQLRGLARLLPPIHRGIFECRLNGNTSQVDLSQSILVRESESALLIEWITGVISTSDRPVHPAWSLVRDFCIRWADSSSPLHDSVRNIWLEFDLDGLTPSLPPPSLFIGLRRETSASEAYIVAEKALDMFLGESGLIPLRDNLHRCFETCPDIAFVNQVGVMLSRRTDALRVCIQDLAPNQIIPYLLQVGWPRPVDELEHLMAGLISFSDHIIMVDIDVSARVHPKVGLEFSVEHKPENKPRWAAFLDDLVERELCTSEKKDALLAWPGVAEPPKSSAPWPMPLIIESLSQPPDCFSVFTRLLSHVKIVYQPQQPFEAKGYLSFEHIWLQPQQAQSTDKDIH